MYLYSYKMTDDTGFAPNPFHGFLTLATCKPGIRLKREKNNWIAGFTSKTLNGDPVGEERLIYLMKIEDKITFDQYWDAAEYQVKKPDNHSKSVIVKAGDNIYRPKIKNPGQFDFEHSGKTRFHTSVELQNRDLRGKYVLISKEYYYFGGIPLAIPDKSIRPDLVNRARYGTLTKDLDRTNRFIEFVAQNSPNIGLIHYPMTWPKEI